MATQLLSNQTTDGSSSDHTLADSDRTLSVYGTFGGCSVDLKLKVETGVYTPFKVFKGATTVVLDIDVGCVIQLEVRGATSSTSVSAVIGPVA